jgi:G3E family GTPase
MGGRIPVHVVTGAPGATAFIEQLCAENAGWAGLVMRAPTKASPNVRVLSAGCPCCTGRVVLQVSLARLLRETGAGRAFVELPDAGHEGSLAKVLVEPPLGQSVVAGRPIRLPGDAALRPADLELGPRS